jgi:hypothetical protein
MRTADIAEPGARTVSGSQFANEVRARMRNADESAKPQGA